MIIIVTNINRKRAKGRPGFISMFTWAALPGNYSFKLPREPLVHSLQITGGRDQTKGEMGACSVKLG